MSTSMVATFRVAEFLFGVPVASVLEVLGPQTLTVVPLAPPAVGGVLNLRGDVVTAVELRHRLGLPARPDGEPPVHVVVSTAGGPVSLLVDVVGEVLTVRSQDFEAAPSALGGPGGELVVGTYRLDGALLLLLDVPRTVDVLSTA